MTADEIIVSVMAHRQGRGFVLPNYYPKGWWECDVYEVTDSGFFYEFEVKVSLSDFHRDSRKTRSKELTREEKDQYWAAHRAWCSGDKKQPCPQWPQESKHDRLARGDVKGPSRFWFVVPAAIEDGAKNRLPQWAGLMVVDHALGPFQAFPVMRELVEAPRLHMKKHVDEHHYRNAYWRYRDLFWADHGRRMAALGRASTLLP